MRCLMVLLGALAGVAAPLGAAAEVPPMINNQGVLRNTAGTPVADGLYTLTFSLYASQSDQSPLWTEDVTGIQVKGGFYSTVLGGVKPFPAGLFRGNELWLGVKVDGNPELPRRRLLTVAYAFEADHALVATTAEGLSCTGCIGAEALDFEPSVYQAGAALQLEGNVFSVDQVAIQEWAKLACYDSPSELRASLDAVYAPAAHLHDGVYAPAGHDHAGVYAETGHTHPGTDVTTPVATALEAANALALEGKTLGDLRDWLLAAVAAAGYMTRNDKVAESQMPANGLDEVSNGLIRNQFQDTTVAGGTPIPIPDNKPTGVESELVFPDIGVAEDLSVAISIANSDISTIEVRLFDPQNVMYRLYAGGSTGTHLAAVYPKPTAPVAGDLSAWIGRNPRGRWYLQVIDDGYKDNLFDGAIEAWSITTRTLSTKKVEVAGDLGVTGDATVNGNLTVGGKITAIGRPVASIWTAENDALADAASLDVDTGVTSPVLVAQAWFAQDDGSWLQASTAADVQTVGGCSACGDGSDGTYVAVGNVTLPAKTWNFRSFTVAAGAVVTVTGSAPLIINVLDDASIDGTIDLRGGRGADGCSGTCDGGAGGGGGGGAGGAGHYGSVGDVGGGPGGGGGGCNATTGSGGGGAGHAASGSAGGTASYSCGTPGAGGAAYGNTLLTGGLEPGSGGGGGGYGTGANRGGGGGGGGGGAIKITASRVTVGVTGAILADGGAGGSQTGDYDGGAGGGGSGGSVWLRGSTVTVLGQVSALGGAGGTVSQTGSYWGGVGGAGAAGRIRVDGSLAGVTTPPAVPGDTEGLPPHVVNRFLITQPSPGLVRLTNRSGKVQKVRLVIMR